MTHAGVYQITHRESGKFYIGSSVELARRWKAHRFHLRRGTHHCRHMQYTANRDGVDAFDFKVLVYCAPDMVLFYEQALINGLKPAYNVAPVAGSALGVKHSQATLDKFKAGARRWRAKHQWKGQTLCLTDIAEMEGIKPETLMSRVCQRGLTVEQAIAMGAPKPMRVLYEHEGEALTMKEWADRLGMHHRRICYWLTEGLTIADCIARLNREAKALSLPEFCKLVGLSHTTVKSRLKAGDSMLEAIRPPRPMERTI